MKNKSSKKIILTILAGFALLAAYNLHQEAKMDEYAKVNNCSWHYDYYINVQPVCK